MKIKTQYNPQTSLVCGYFPESKDYSLVVVIDEQNKTIDDLPYIEIEEADQVLDKEMCVVDGVYQEYIEPLEEALKKAKANKIIELKKARNTLLESKKFTIDVEGVSCQFWLRNSDLSALQSRFASLLDNEATRSWGAVDGSRVELNKPAYLSLIRHITDNDETVFGEYVRMKEEIESAPDLEALEEIDINFNL